MTTDQLRELQRRRPFQPFTMHLADGRTVHIPHPEMFVISQGGRTVAVLAGEESFHIVDILLITSLTVGNGQARHGER